MNNELIPPLKWAGGKRWLAPTIQKYWDAYTGQGEHRLVEPLCGGLAVALHIQPRTALLNDINPHLINFYNQLKNGLIIESEMKNDKEFFYERREEFNSLIKDEAHLSKRAAELFYYLNRSCFNGLCRFNRKGFFNTPFGSYKTINYRRDFSAYKALFANWTFTNRKFEDIILEPADFVYADPPYDVEFTQYAKDGFSWEDQIRLAELLAKHSGPVLLSNQATERVLSLYRENEFINTLLMGPRNISADKTKRTPVAEVLAIKNIPVIE